MHSSLPRFLMGSLIAVTATAAVATQHHVLEVGLPALLLIPIFMVAPVLVVSQYLRTEKNAYLIGYGILNVWLIFGFGVVESFVHHVLPTVKGLFDSVLSLHSALDPSFAFLTGENITGCIVFTLSLLVTYFGYRIVTLIHVHKKFGESI